MNQVAAVLIGIYGFVCAAGTIAVIIIIVKAVRQEMKNVNTRT